MNVKAKITKLFDKNSKIKAVASVTIDDSYAVHGIKIIDSIKGLFVSMPSTSYQKNGETKHQDIFHAVTSEARQSLIDAVETAYKNELSQTESETESFEQSM